MIYQMLLDNMRLSIGIEKEKCWRKIITPGNFYIFTVSISRTQNWKETLEKYGLLDKIIYQSKPSWAYAHMEREAPSSFCVICAT